MKALVTGGGGFLGRAIVERLRDRGDKVRVLSRGDYPALRALGAETVRGDITDIADVIKSCEGVDAVFHVAALPGIWGPWRRFYRTNVTGTENVLDGCRRNGVKKLIYTSSPSVVFDASVAVPLAGVNESHPYPEVFGCYYAQTKAKAEQLVLAANRNGSLLTTSLRPHLIWGPRDNHLIPRLVARAKAGKLIRVGDGTNKVDLTYVDNAADAHVLAADRLEAGSPVAGSAYFISDGHPVRLWDWIDTLLKRAGLPPITRSITYARAQTIGTVLEAIYFTFHITAEPRMTRFLASQLAGDHYYDISRAKRDLGYSPTIDNETGVQRVLDWLKER